MLKNILKIGLAVLLMVVTAMVLEAKTVSGLILGTVIVGGQWDSTMQLFRTGLSKKMHKMTWYYGKWSKLIGWIDVQSMKEAGTYAGSIQLKPTGNVIDVVRDYQREGGIYMEIPVQFPLRGQGRYGSAQLEGHEEKRIVMSKKNAINQLRHGVIIQDTKMSKQVLQKIPMQQALMERGYEDLKDWFGRKIGFYPYQALMQGYSDNLTDGTYGVNRTAKSHPNLYVKGYGKATWSATPATYETNVATALSSLSDEDTDKFTCKSLRDMSYIATLHMIEPVKIAGGEYYIVFISPGQMRQLRQDSEWQQIHREAGVRGPGNQIFTGMTEGYPFEGLYIIVDNTIPGARISGDTGYDATRGTINYGGALYMATPRDLISVRRGAILVGQGAISCGYGEELSFDSRTADYGELLADAARAILGMERADIYDDDNYLGGGADSFYGNFSSLEYFTYSPETADDI